MAQPMIKFFRVATLPTSGIVQGALYFVTSENVLYVAGGTTTDSLVAYSGVRNASYANEKLILVNHDGVNVEVDLSVYLQQEDLENYATTSQVTTAIVEALAPYAKIDDVNAELNKKADLTALNELTAVVEGKAAQSDLEALSNVVDSKADASVVEGIEGRLQTAEGKISTLEGQVANVYTKGEIDTKVEAINGAIAEKANVADVYTKTEVDTLLKDVTDAASTLESRVKTNEDNIAELSATVEDIEDRLQTAEGEIDTLQGQVTTLIGDDVDKSVRTIANEELAKQLIAEGAAESLDTLQEIAQWIQDHPDDASQMNADIEQLKKDVDAIEADYLTSTDKTELTGAIATAKTGAIDAAAANTTTAIEALDAEVTSTDGVKVTVKVTEVDGKITAVNVTESDIASAEALTALEDEVSENAEVTAAALVDINNRLEGVESTLESGVGVMSVTDGTTNGTINVDGKSITVTELSDTLEENSDAAFTAGGAYTMNTNLSNLIGTNVTEINSLKEQVAGINTGVQSVTAEAALEGGSSDYVSVVASGDKDVVLTSQVKLAEVVVPSGADVPTATGLATDAYVQAALMWQTF